MVWETLDVLLAGAQQQWGDVETPALVGFCHPAALTGPKMWVLVP